VISYLLNSYLVYVSTAFFSVLALLWALKDKYSSKELYSFQLSSKPGPFARLFIHSLVSIAIAIPTGFILANLSSQETKENLINEVNILRQKVITTIAEQEKTIWANSDVLSSWPRKTPFPLILSIDDELAKWKMDYASLSTRVSRVFSPATSRYCRNAWGIVDQTYCVTAFQVKAEKDTCAVNVYCQFFKEEVDELLYSLDQCAKLGQQETGLFFVPKP
jgi:hypothetical protein